MLGPSLTVAHLAITTVCTALMIGLGFLSRPSRATVLWSSMFVLGLVSAYGAVRAEVLDSDRLWLLSVGALLSAPALVWAGLRAMRGARRSYAWGAAVIGVAVIVILLAGAGRPGFHVLGRTVFLLTTLVNVLVIIELVRRPERGRGITLPLVLASGMWVVIGSVGLLAALLDMTANYELLTQSNAVAVIVYMVCALVTLLFIARGNTPIGRDAEGVAFRAIAADRLRRAEAGGEHTWTLLDIRLDDPDDLRAAAGDAGFEALSERFHRTVRASFPAEADIAAVSPSRAMALLARTPSMVRTGARRLLDDLAEVDPDGPLAVQLSASIGWASVAELGYNFDQLSATAEQRASVAAADGGNRWVRA